MDGASGAAEFALGQATRFDNGNTIVNWGGVGVIREVTPAGDIVWEMTGR